MFLSESTNPSGPVANASSVSFNRSLFRGLDRLAHTSFDQFEWISLSSFCVLKGLKAAGEIRRSEL